MGVAGFFLSTTLLIWGAEHSLNAGLERLGADIVVVPSGAETKIETALLMGKPTQIWMPDGNLDRIAAIPGVSQVSPQIYLSSLYGASCCAVSEMFLVVFDQQTDFTIRPWLQKQGIELQPNEVIGGSLVFTPVDEQYITLYGHDLMLKGNLEATGTGLDQTLFMTVETARNMAQTSLTKAIEPLVIQPDQISAVMVKLAPGADIHTVSQKILLDVPGAFPIESPSLFGTYRQQMTGLLWGFMAVLAIGWVLCVALIGLIFSMAASERRREVSVLRALGASRGYVFQSLLSEVWLIALAASVLGFILAAFGIYIFRDFITGAMGIPFLFPSMSSFTALFLTGVLLALATVTLAALLPALRMSKQEPALAMR
jgi:putative ABC transport system permease protein